MLGLLIFQSLPVSFWCKTLTATFFWGVCVVPQWDENCEVARYIVGILHLFLHTICSETKFTHFFLVQDWIIIVLDILRKQSCSKLMPNMAWAKAETL